MHKLYDYVCDELKTLEKKADNGGLSMSEIEYADTLAHLGKNLDKIMEADEGYSGRYEPTRYYDGRSYRGSYARHRDSMGRYSRDGMADKLRELMHDAPDEQTRKDIERLASKVEGN